jgi:hypothetical protein
LSSCTTGPRPLIKIASLMLSNCSQPIIPGFCYQWSRANNVIKFSRKSLFRIPVTGVDFIAKWIRLGCRRNATTHAVDLVLAIPGKAANISVPDDTHSGTRN